VFGILNRNELKVSTHRKLSVIHTISVFTVFSKCCMWQTNNSTAEDKSKWWSTVVSTQRRGW